MKHLTSQMHNHLQEEVTSLASCWAITRTDGVEILLTDHDQDLIVDGRTYVASEGYDRNVLKSSSGTDTDEMDIAGHLNSSWIKEDDLKAGIFDHAQVLFFLVNWQSSENGVIPLRKGWIGEVSWQDGGFRAELRGLSNSLKREIGVTYTPECNADFGDVRCGVDVSSYRISDTISEVLTPLSFSVGSFDGDDELLVGGVLTCGTGANAGRSMEISGWNKTAKKITLFLPFPYSLKPGDSVSFHRGCDKRFVTCQGIFSNQLNFRGFPHVPGTDALTGASYV